MVEPEDALVVVSEHTDDKLPPSLEDYVQGYAGRHDAHQDEAALAAYRAIHDDLLSATWYAGRVRLVPAETVP